MGWKTNNREKYLNALSKELIKQMIEFFDWADSNNDIKVISISEITGMDSVMDGRVKTLHPKIFGGILADRNNSKHL